MSDSSSTGRMCERGDRTSAPNVPNYTLSKKLGQGGMGEVFLARHDGTDEQVAIKFLLLPERSSEPELRLRFDRETGLLAQLNHPNIIRVLDHGVADGRPYLVMEYMSGGTLRGWMTPGQPLSVSKVRHVVTGVIQALTALEERQIVHRDLKPENVLLDADGQVKVTDFGISAAVTEVGQVTSTAQILGTLDYIAPEQRTRLDVDTRADQYSLAVMVYELLTGKRPVGNYKPPSLLNRQLHPAVDTTLSRALNEDPDDRFGSVSAFAESFDLALQRRPRPWLRPAARAAGILLIASLSVGALVAWKKGQDGPASTTGNPSDPVPPVEPIVLLAERAVKTNYFIERGDSHLAAGRDREAESCYTEAIRLSPREPPAYLKRAYVYKKKVLYQKALDDLQVAVDLDATRVEAWTGRGSIYVQLEDYARAIPELDRALALNPQSAETLAWRGRARYKLGQEDLARQDLDTSAKLDGNLGIAYQFRALMHLAAKNNAQARKDLEDAVRCMPDNPHAHAKLSDLLAQCPDAELRDRPRAILHARKACELTQWQGWEELRYLAKAYAAAGELPAAIQWCEKALALTPELKRSVVQTLLAGFRKRHAAEKRSP